MKIYEKILRTSLQVKIQVVLFFILMIAAIWCFDQVSKDSNTVFGEIRQEMSEKIQRKFTGTYIDRDGYEWSDWEEVTSE